METKTHYRILTDDVVLQSYLARMAEFTHGPWAYLPIKKVDSMFSGPTRFIEFCKSVMTKGARPARTLSVHKVAPNPPKNLLEHAELLFGQPAQPWTYKDQALLAGKPTYGHKTNEAL